MGVAGMCPAFPHVMFARNVASIFSDALAENRRSDEATVAAKYFTEYSGLKFTGGVNGDPLEAFVNMENIYLSS